MSLGGENGRSGEEQEEWAHLPYAMTLSSVAGTAAATRTCGCRGGIWIDSECDGSEEAVGILTIALQTLQTGDESGAMLAGKDVIFRVRGAVDARVFRIRRQGCDAFGNVLRKEDLAGVGNVSALIGFLRGTGEVHLHVDVDGAALIPAWIERFKLGDSGGVCKLHAAQEACGIDIARAAVGWGWRSTGPSAAHAAGTTGTTRSTRPARSTRSTRPAEAGAHRCKAGIDAFRIAVPDIECCIGKWFTGSRVDHAKTQAQRDSGFIFDEVLPELGGGNVVWALFLLCGEGAGGVSGQGAEGGHSGGAGEQQGAPRQSKEGVKGVAHAPIVGACAGS